MATVIPVARSLVLCEEVDVESGLLNVYGLFDALRADVFPYTRDSFSVFVQLSGGLGDVACYYDIRRASDGDLIHTSAVRTLRFLRRTQLLQVMTAFENIRFETAGVYLVELFCENTWVADVAFDVSEHES